MYKHFCCVWLKKIIDWLIYIYLFIYLNSPLPEWQGALLGTVDLIVYDVLVTVTQFIVGGKFGQ